MKKKTGEDGDRHTRRRMKTETVEDEDRLTLGTSEVAAPYSWRHPRVTKTEADDDGGRRRQRQTMTETDEDRLTLETSEEAAPLQLTTPHSDEDRTWYFSSHETRWLSSPWRTQKSLQPQVQSWNRSSSVVFELAFRKTLVMERWQSPQGVPTGLTEDELQNSRYHGLN